MRKYLMLFFLFLSFASHGQFRNTPHQFIRYLINKKFYDEAVLVLNEKLQYATSQPALDSLNLMLGKTYYFQQKLSESIHYLDRVSKESEALQIEAGFFSALNEAYLKKFDTSFIKFRQVPTVGESQRQLKIFELAGVSLLQNKLTRFDSLKKEFSDTWTLGIEQQKNLDTYRGFLERDKKKPAVAGLLSAVIPGAGKFYTGRKGNGIFTLLISTLLGLQTYEAYQKDGPSSARFIIYGSLFTTFYVANIWGSVLAVKVVRNEKKDAIQDQILLDMHIPLRTLFQ